MSILDAHYINERNCAYLIQEKRANYPDFLERVKIETHWGVIEEICSGIYIHIDEQVEQSLVDDVKRIMGAKLW